MNARHWLVALVALMGSVGITAACGSDDNNANGGNGQSSGGNGTTSGLFGTGDGGPGSSGGDGSSGGNGNCFAPVDMFIMFDRSNSMGADCNLGQNATTKWCRAITALSGYFKSQAATNQAAALQFFPVADHDEPLCTTGNKYNVADLPPTGYTPLPTDAFDARLNSIAPNAPGTGDGTPTEAAIRGLNRFTEANRRGGRVTIGILITDGDPRGCVTNLQTLSDLLAAHNTATKVRTYVIGMTGASFENLEQIATGGQGPTHPDSVGSLTNACGGRGQQCRAWNVGDGDPAAFIQALTSIQESADGCKEGGGFVNPVN